MGSGDFFKIQMKMPLAETFLIASLSCRLITNSEAIVAHARERFTTPPSLAVLPDVTLRFWVDAATESQSGLEKPHFRGVGSTVFASFGRRNFLLMNLAKGRVAGRFTHDFVEDESGFGRTVFPIVVTTLGPANGISVVHSACVADRHRSLLLAGPSGSGKSTLALALSELGYECLADDRTYMSSRDGGLLCWGAGNHLKLRAEALKYFPKIGSAEAASRGGLEPLTVDQARYFGPRRRHYSEPSWILFLEPKEGTGLQLRDLTSREAAARLEDGVMQETEQAVANQLDAIRRLAERPSYVCRYSGTPQAVARELAGVFFSSTAGRPAKFLAEPVEEARPSVAVYRDPLRRFIPLTHRTPIQVMGRSGVLETNSLQVIRLAQRFMESRDSSASDGLAFTWKIATEEGERLSSPWPQPSGLAAEGMRCISLGPTGFIAADLETCEIAGFTSECRVADVAGFAGVFLAAMAHVTAAALRITPVSSACIAKQHRGLLLLGPSGCGKTSCAYAAHKLGFEIHSDMVTFLERRGERLDAWGEFWPALFRMETARFHPELLHLGEPLKHESETFISVEKSRLAPGNGSSITPALALFLERNKVKMPRLTRLPRAKYDEILRASCPYAEEPQNQSRRNSVLSELLKIPAYQLTFGEDPAEAAVFCRSLFATYESLGLAR